MSEVYWRVYVGSDDLACVVCMQDFDECDYNQSRFLTDEKFELESSAEDWLNEHVHADKIREKFRGQKSLRETYLKC